MDGIIVHRKAKRHLLTVGGLILLWIIIQIFKSFFVDVNDTVGRMFWYLYYVPITLIPLCLFYATLCFQMNETHPFDRRWYLLLIPAGILIALFLTNDLHQLAFAFSSPEMIGDYAHGIVYYLEILWNILLLGGSLIMLMIRTFNPAYRNFRILPFLPLVIGTALVFLTFFHVPVISYFTFSEYYYLMIILFFECLTVLKMIPTNVGYEEYFTRSSLNMMITDNKMNPVYVASMEVKYPSEVLSKALGSAYLIDENHQLSSEKIPGGYVFYSEDLSDIHEAQRKLTEYNDVLFECRELLESENELAEKRGDIQIRSEIYGNIYQIIQPEYDFVMDKLGNVDINDPSFVSVLRLVSVTDAYIKRISNLLLMKQGKDELSITDLLYSFEETAIYLRLASVDIDYHLENCPDSLPADVLISVYQFFWKIIFPSLETMESVGVFLSDSDGRVKLRLFLEGEKEEFIDKTESPLYVLTRETEEDTVVYTAVFGGEEHD